jgi:uncharacterized sulfatase
MPDRRQVVLIMTDTQRWDMVNCYRHTGLQTPNLDRLAAGGVRFERAYTCQPVCGPARSALFTGTYPHSNGSWANCMALGDNVKTIGQRLRDHGLRTAYIGKWHLDGGDYFGLGRCPDGWDDAYWYDMRRYLEELSPADRLRSRKMSTIQEDIPEEFTFGHRCSNRAVDFLRKYNNQDFLLVVSYDEPHGPCLCPKKYFDMYADFAFPTSPNMQDRLADKPEHLRVWSASRPAKAAAGSGVVAPAFFGCNTFVDCQIGRVLDAIDRHCPDALVIYTSDHGDGLGSHGISNKGPAMFDEIARIPFIVRWPGHAPAGAVNPHIASHIDVVPSLMEYFGLPVPRLLEGRSMLGACRDPAVRTNDVIFLEFGRYEIDHDDFGGFQPIRCAFDGRYKLVINLMTSDELYDLQTDPGEMTNLIDSPDHASARNGLHDRLLDWMNRTRDPFRGYYWERRPWRADARPATWKYTGMTRQRENEEYEPRQLDYNTGLPMEQATRPK